MKSQYIYTMKGLAKNVNGRQIIKETWLSFLPEAKIGIIGQNGSGKSTLMKIIAGLDKEFDGETWLADGVKIGYLPQEPQLDSQKNVFDNILLGLKHKKQLLDEFNDISNQFTQDLSTEAMDDLIRRQAELQDKIDAIDGWNLENEIDIAMTALGCPVKDADINNISGGEKRRVALCRLLLEKPDLLLLDEPTNHLDAHSTSWLENYLKSYHGTVIIITHDRYFLDNVVEWLLEIERGQCVPWHCNYSSWLVQKQKKTELIDKENQAIIKQLERELEWLRQPAKARQAKSKSRITSYHELLTQSQQKVVINSPQIIIPSGPRLGNLVIEINNLTKKFGDKILLQDFSCIIPPGAIVGIIGPNGAGKSTLFNIIAGKETLDAGEIIIGPTVKLGYVDQVRDKLDNNKTVWEEISEGLEEVTLSNKTIKTRAYCAAFNFRGADQQKKVGQLSGGERNRVHIAKLLKTGANVILLDEPSNDLDIDTLRALEDAITEFVGCIMVISHDRWFLDRIATHIIAFDGENNATWFEGNYQDYHNYIVNILGKDLNKTKNRHKKFAL